MDQLQLLQQILLKNKEATNESQSSVKFDKKLLDFDYGEEEDDDVLPGSSPVAAPTHNASTGGLESLGLLLTNPEVRSERSIKHLRFLNHMNYRL